MRKLYNRKLSFFHRSNTTPLLLIVICFQWIACKPNPTTENRKPIPEIETEVTSFWQIQKKGTN